MISKETIRNIDMSSRELLESLPICIKIIDRDSRLQYLSSAGQKMLKIADIESYYGSVYPPEFYPDWVRERLIEHLDRALAGETSRLEAPVFATDGTELWFDTTFKPELDANGEVNYIIGTSINITLRKKMEIELLDAQQHLDSFFVDSPAGLAIIDDHLQYIKINQTLADINGSSVHDHIGKTVKQVLPKLAPTIEPMLRKVINDGTAFLNCEIIGETPEKPGVTRHWKVSYFPIKSFVGKTNSIGVILTEDTKPT